MAQPWCTEEAILKDLAEGLGTRVGEGNLGQYLYGDHGRPRLSAVIDEDEEFDLRFGRSEAGAPCGSAPLPDLAGITSTLREVQNYENTAEDELPLFTSNKIIVISKPEINKSADNSFKRKTPSPAKNNTGVIDNKSPYNVLSNTANLEKLNTNGAVVSKLNPNVKEFIPKTAQISSMKVEHISAPTTNKQNIDCNVVDIHRQCVYNANTDINEKLHNDLSSKIANVNNGDSSKKVKHEIELLKNLISAKNDTLHDQQQAYRAAASLIKLYADPKTTKPLKLLPPQYFETKPAQVDVKETLKTDCSIEPKALLQNVKEVSLDHIPFKGQTIESSNITIGAYQYDKNKEALNDVTHGRNTKKNNEDSCKIYQEYISPTVINEEVETTELTPDMDHVHLESTTLDESIDPYVQESINKVNNWLQNKPVVTTTKVKPKSPQLHLGPIAYKRKDLVNRKSPNELTSKKVPKAAEYEPSSYAAELLKKYNENSKAKSPTPALNIWEKLEADLKEKDEEIKNRRKNI